MARKKRVDNKGRVLRTGEMQRSEDNLYVYRYTDLFGKKKTIYAPTLEGLRDKEMQITRDLQDGIDTSKGDMSLNELFELFMKTKSGLREGTKSNYREMWQLYVESAPLGSMKISQIKQINIMALYSDMMQKKLAEGTISIMHNLLSSVLDMALQSDMIRKNPAKGCKKNIKGPKNERRALTRAEQDALISYINKSVIYSKYEPLISFALATGLRVGELTGLRWEDIDFKKNVIHIRRQLLYRDYGDGLKHYFQDLKTKAGRRDIPLTDAARGALVREKELCLSKGMEGKRKEVEGVSDFVFINREGMPYEANILNTDLRALVNRYNKDNPDGIQMPHISCHILRHTFCSRAAESGINPKVLQYIMGHSDISITLNTYTHIDYEEVEAEMREAEKKLRVS